MRMPNKYYDILKWVVMIASPAIAFFIQNTGPAMGITNVDNIVTILNGITLLLGALIGVSTYTYNKEDHTDEK